MTLSRTAATLALLVAAPAVQAADIEFWYGNTGRPETAIQNACEAFNQSQDAHSIKCVGQGSYEAGMQTAIAAYRSKKHPVLIQFFDAGTLDLMLSGAVRPVEELMPEVDWDDYIEGARSYYETSTGKLYSQPYNGSTLIFYGNREMMDEAGIDALPETFEEAIAAAQKLKDAGVECPLVTDGNPWRILEQFAARHGVPIATNHNGYGGLDAEYVFDEGLIATHLTNLAQWHDNGLLKLQEDTAAGSYDAAFYAGECAMMEGSTGSYGAAVEALGDNVEIGYAPMYEGHERFNTLIGGASLWTMKDHSDEDYEAAKAFLDFLREPEQQIEFTRMTGYVPVTETALKALQDSGKADEVAFATATTGVDSLNMPGNEDSRGVRLGFYVQFRDIFTEETGKAFFGEQTMEAALDNAKTRGDELLRRFEQTYQGVALP